MHGRVKVRTTAEQDEIKRKDREQTLVLYNKCMQKLFEKRARKEYDAEALEISANLLVSNPDLITLWNYRKEMFIQLKEEKGAEEFNDLLVHELNLTVMCLANNPKSYGSWYHRLWVLDKMALPNWKRELDLCAKYLNTDERNFHCWDYRRHIVKRAKVSPEEELAFTDNKIKTNFSNYSSWHYRSKLLQVLHPDPNKQLALEEGKLCHELELVQNAAFTDPNDQSAWFYHRWLLSTQKDESSDFQLNFVAYNSDLEIVMAAFTKPVIIGSNGIRVDLATVGNINWKSTVGSVDTPSLIWVASIERNTFQTNQIAVSCFHGESSAPFCSLSITLAEGTGSYFSASANSTSNLFRTDLSDDTRVVLVRELESCVQLLDLEPDSKWTLLTSIVLMRSIDTVKYSSEVEEFFSKLIAVDSARQAYYKDLRSKFIIEDFLEGRDRTTWTAPVELKAKSLTSLPHLDRMALVERVDLSTNQLTKLANFHFLQFLQDLNLDDNSVSSCEGLANLRSLSTLSMKRNKVTKLEDVQGLAGCSRLRSLDLTGCPLCDTCNFDRDVRKLLSQLERLNGN